MLSFEKNFEGEYDKDYGVWKLICLRTSKGLVWGNLINQIIPIHFPNKIPIFVLN